MTEKNFAGACFVVWIGKLFRIRPYGKLAYQYGRALKSIELTSL